MAHPTSPTSGASAGTGYDPQAGATGGESEASGATEQAKEKVQQGAEQAKSTVRTQVDQRSTEAGQKISTQADDIRTVAQQLREQGKEGPAKVAEQAAERAQSVGRYLEQSDADRILGDVEDFARRQPWTVLAGGLAAGFLASRFLKASSTQRFQSGSASPQPRPTSGNGHGQPTQIGSGANRPVPPSTTTY